MIKKIANQYKKNPSIFFLFFSIPLILNAFADYSANEDIWYMLKYGKYILHHGFPHTDMLSMHTGLHIVVQQSFSNIIYYIVYHFGNVFGIFLLLQLFTVIYLFVIYKFCMLLSKNKFLSATLSIISVILLQHLYIIPRSQIFTYLFVLIVLYIMELFIRNNNTKLVYFLPLISLLQINLHAALWYLLFIVMIPYIIDLIIKKNKKVIIILSLMIIMFLVGFINPYTYENVFFPFLNYDPIMSKYIEELLPISLEISFANNFSVVFYSIIATIILIYIYYKKGTLRFRNLLLLGGITTMALINNRSFAFFIIICIPLLADYLKDIPYDFDNNYSNKKKIWVLIILFTLIVPLFQKNKLTSIVYKEANYIKNNYSKDVVLYTTFNEGSYCEYIGLHPYIDTRAEVFLKKENRKKDYFREFIKTYYGYKSPKYIIKKYKFTHFIVEKESHMYNYLNKQDKYIKKVFSKDFAVFILKD